MVSKQSYWANLSTNAPTSIQPGSDINKHILRTFKVFFQHHIKHKTDNIVSQVINTL